MENLETGDIILFSSNYWYSNLIEYFGQSKYSHVGMVLKNPTYIHPSLNDGLYFIESGYENMKDVEDYKKKFGVQINKLDKIIDQNKKAGTKIFYRKLVLEDEKKRLTFSAILEKAHKIIHNKPYNTIVQDWVRAEIALKEKSFDHFTNAINKKTSTFWCSALVAYLYVQLGLLDENTPWTIVPPKEFSETSSILKFVGCSLDKETSIDE